MKKAARKNLRKQDVLAIADTREKYPLDLAPLNVVRKCLKTGDYSVLGYESSITVELKELDDFVQCCTTSRERFERELERMLAYPYRAIVIKSTWGAIERQEYRSEIVPQAVIGSAMGFAMNANVSIIMAEDHKKAGLLVARLLWVSANRCHWAGISPTEDQNGISSIA